MDATRRLTSILTPDGRTKFPAALILGAAMLFFAAPTQATWLHWTNPKYNSSTDDSGYVQCVLDVMNPLKDLGAVRVYVQYITGGPARLLDTLSVSGREGLEDSIQVDPGPGAHFWLTAVDMRGNECCVSPQVYVGPITAVAVEARAERETSYRVFDVRGRLTQPRAAGVYFFERRYSSGRIQRGKIVRVK